uniref:Uncharacterized protein n=1 Tax=viral metagenome TaxID=1070528 RepID=A0A6C0I9Z6_9ZZZZ
MNWYLILYIFLAIVIGTYPTMVLYQSGRGIAAIVYIVSVLLVLTFYGLRWIRYGPKHGGKGGAWPPVINTCPDYLTFFNRPDDSAPNGMTPTCIDFLGVSRNTGISKWRHDMPLDNPSSDDKYYFDLKTTSADLTLRNQELCARAVEKGLSWEGITNGESCYIPSLPVNQDGSSAETKQCTPGPTAGA